MFQKVELEEIFPDEYIREEEAELPEVSELDIMRHYTALIQTESWSGFWVLSTWLLYDEI